MDKLISTLVLASVIVALAITLMAYYPRFMRLFMNYEQLSFDYTYTSVKDSQAEIVIRFRNTWEGKLTIVALEINSVEMDPKGHNPIPLKLPSPYEVAIRTASGGTYVKVVVIP